MGFPQKTMTQDGVRGAARPPAGVQGAAPPGLARAPYRTAPVRTMTASAALDRAIWESTWVASRRKPQPL